MEQDPAKLPPPRRSPVARLLAPLALVLAVVVLIMVFSSSLGSDDSDGGGDRGARSERNQSGGGGGGGGGGGRGQGQRPPKRYEVQEGDSLSAIAERFDVPVEDIVELNPDVDPQALSTGEELKLR